MKNPSKEQINSTENERIDIAFEQSIAGSYGAIRGSVLVFVIFYWETQDISYLFWVIGTLIASTSRILLAKSFIKRAPVKQQYKKWLNYNFLSSFFTGLSWGALVCIDISNLPLIYKVLTFLIVAFINVGAVSSYSYVIKSYYIFLAGLTTIFFIGLLVTQGLEYITLMILFVAVYPTLIVASKQLHSSLIYSLTKQFEVEDLLSKLQLNHEHLERKISERTADLVEAKEMAELANHAKSEFLANMTHELRTPLHAILSFSKLGINKRDSISIDKLVGYSEKIHKSGERLLDLMDNLLELSKFDAGKIEFIIEKVPMSEILNNTLVDFEALIQEKSVQLNLEILPQERELMLDQSRISQVIKNLLSNAIKFSPENGRIKISIYHEDMTIGRRDTDHKIQTGIKFSISDEGVGIPDGELFVIFDKFIQSSHTKTGAGGTGLGLAICKEIIEAHSGKIWAENNPDKGASFHFIIPLPD